jgi:oxygen-dependent protoporphyrinogen oxidase
MPPTPTRIAIIGGGISGLSAALRVQELAVEQQRDVRITLLEGSDRLGGVLQTEHIGDYLVEHAADMWITNKPEGVRLCEKLGLAERLIPTNAQFRKSLVLRSGRAHPVPEGFQLMVPEQAWPMLRSPLLSWRGKLRLMAECFVPARCDGADESLADFVRRRCGREAFERLVQPLVGGIYTADPEKLSLLATLPRFIEMEQQSGSLIRGALRQSRSRSTGTSGARYGLFVSLPNGIEELVAALKARVTQFAEIRCGVKIRAVRSHQPTRNVSEGGVAVDAESSLALADASGWSVEGSRLEHFDAVVLAVPSYVAASLLAEGCPALAAELNRIEYASTIVVASGHKLADVEHPLDAFGLVLPHIERRQVLAVSFTSRKFPGRAPDGRVLLRTFVGGALQPELCELDDSAILDLVRRELRDLLGVCGEPDFAHPFRHTRAMPQYHVGHLELVTRIRASAATCPGLALAGNYLTGVGIPDSIASGEVAAAQVMS